MMNRRGVGKLRHLEVKTLWIQSKVNSKLITMQSVPGESSPADLGTKALSGDRVTYLKELLNVTPIDYSQFGNSSLAEAVVASIRLAIPLKQDRVRARAVT